VSALMLARAVVLACGLAHRESAMPAGRPCPDCAVSCTTDSVRAAAVQRARSATRDGDWNDAADRWRDALLLDAADALERATDREWVDAAPALAAV